MNTDKIDLPDYLGDIVQIGIEKCMEGQSIFDPSARFTYYDARDSLGFIIECVTKNQ